MLLQHTLLCMVSAIRLFPPNKFLESSVWLYRMRLTVNMGVCVRLSACVCVCEREHVRVRERCGAAFVYDDSFTLCGFCDWKLHLIMCTYAFSRKQHATPQEKPTTTLYFPPKWQNTVYTIWIYNAMYYYIIQYLDWLFYTHSTGILNIVIIIK